MEKNTVLRWVKASERLPDDGGYYFVRIGKLKDKHLLPRMQLIEKWRIYGEGGVEVEWLEESESPAPLSAEEVLRKYFDKHIKRLCGLSFEEVSEGTGYKWIYEAMHDFASQRQPVAPEREEERMSAASQWFDGLSDDKRQHYIDAFPRLTVRGLYEQVMSETSPSAENKGGEG